VLIVDDGFQSRRLRRTLDLVVVDATSVRTVLPAGPMREAWSALGQADVLWLHKTNEAGAQELGAGLTPHLQSQYRIEGIEDAEGAALPMDWLSGRTVRPICGLGRPSSFYELLDAYGASRDPGYEVADHGHFELEVLEALGREGGLWVTTEKDRERIPATFGVVTIRIGLALDDPAALGRVDAELGIAP